MAAMKRTLAVEIFWKIHPIVYRMTGGRLLGELMGMPVLLLTTTGARTGQRRTTPLTYLPDGERYVVIGSFLGEPRHPGWVHNLRKDPKAEVQVGPATRAVVAHEAQGEERARRVRAAERAGARVDDRAVAEPHLPRHGVAQDI